MLVKDSIVLEREARELPRETHLDRVQKWLTEQEKHNIYVEDGNLNPANVERQLGKPMTSADLERRLEKILPPNVKFITNPWVQDKRVAILILPDGTMRTLVPYERGFMPEHSILKVKTEWIRDKTVTHIDRKDLPKSEFIPGVGHVFETGDDRPGWRKVHHLWGEEKRGWRTVLLRLVRNGVTTPEAVERVFGADDSAAWAANLGKKNIILPW